MSWSYSSNNAVLGFSKILTVMIIKTVKQTLFMFQILRFQKENAGFAFVSMKKTRQSQNTFASCAQSILKDY